jgi:putative sigma-54 modulation protein
MEFTFKTKNIDLNESLKEYAMEKIGIVEKYFHPEFPIRAEVELEKITQHHLKGKIFSAIVNLHLQDRILRAQCTDSDVYLAINGVKKHLKVEVKKYKDTITEKHHR